MEDALLLEDIACWRARAAQMRARMADVTDPEVERVVGEMIDEYEGLIERAAKICRAFGS